MGATSPEARDTHPAPIGPPIALMIGDHGRPQAPKRVTPTRPQWPPIALAHDRRPWETTGPEARDTHPAPIGPNCAHHERPQARARDTHPAPIAPIVLMIGDHGRPQARARDTHAAHDRRPWETTGPKRLTPTRPQWPQLCS